MPSDANGPPHAGRCHPCRCDAGPRVGATPVGPEDGEAGYSTAELLGNAALAIGALGLIWVAIGDMGQEIVEWIGSQLMSE